MILRNVDHNSLFTCYHTYSMYSMRFWQRRHVDVWVSANIAAWILNHSTRWRSVVIFTTRPLYPALPIGEEAGLAPEQIPTLLNLPVITSNIRSSHVSSYLHVNNNLHKICMTIYVHINCIRLNKMLYCHGYQTQSSMVVCVVPHALLLQYIQVTLTIFRCLLKVNWGFRHKNSGSYVKWRRGTR
jgi:hypothetical protein